MSTGETVPTLDQIVPGLDADIHDLRSAMNNYLHDREKLLDLSDRYREHFPEKIAAMMKELEAKRRILRSRLLGMYKDLEEKF